MNKSEAMTKVRNDVVLSQIVCLASVAVESIIDQALAHPIGVDRWPCYEQLKRQAHEIVGWEAIHPELATSEHYEAMVGFIDQLLPIASENDIPDQDELARRRREGRGLRHISGIVNGCMDDLAERYQRRLDGQVG